MYMYVYTYIYIYIHVHVYVDMYICTDFQRYLGSGTVSAAAYRDRDHLHELDLHADDFQLGPPVPASKPCPGGSQNSL